MAEGVDYSWARPSASCLYNNGRRFAVRYIGTPSSGKNLTAGEAQALRVSGVEIVATYETTAGFMLGGYDRGVQAAIAANQDARQLGMPAGRPVYYALDVDPRPFTAGQWGAIEGFLAGARTRGEPVGVYGAHLAIERLVPNHARFGWQTYAWSGGRLSAKAHLFQYRNGQSLCGGTVDFCRSFAADYGQWGYNPAEPPPPPSLPLEDEPMLVTRYNDPAAGYWFLHGDTFFHLNDTLTVSNLAGKGVDEVTWSQTDFDRLVQEKGREEELANIVAMYAAATATEAKRVADDLADEEPAP